MSGTPFELNDLVIRAGAGAGKTTGLVEHVYAIFKDWRKNHGRSPRLVLTTFTRKATQELKERLIRKACADQNADFLKFVSSPSELQISTIHGLLNSFLQQAGHLADLDSGFRLQDEDEALEFSRLILRDVLVDNPSYMKWLERLGFSATLRMVRRFATFESEQGELRAATLDDIEKAVGPEIAKWRAVWLEFAATILEEVDEEKWQAYALELQAFWQNFSTDKVGEFPKKPEMRSKVQKELSVWHEKAAENLKAFQKIFAQEGWKSSHWEAMSLAWSEFLPLARAFSALSQERKWSGGQFELADLEFISHKILTLAPDLADAFAGEIDYWMIDEYQDTSPLQEKILDALIGEKPRYIVGDPQQSIYLFRGSDVHVFSRAEEETKKSGGQVEERRTNYRSDPSLLHMINDFVRSVDPSFEAMNSHPEKSLERDECMGFFIRTEDRESEIEAIVARIENLLHQGTALQSMCVLARTNDQLKSVAEALRRRGYPTHLHASRGFEDRREVLDAKCLWRFLVNPHDTHNLVALLRSPWFYVPDATLTKWLSARTKSLWWSLKDTDHETLSRLREAREQLSELGVVKAFEKTLKDAGYLDLALFNDPAGRKESNLWKVIATARTLEGESRGSLLSLAGSGRVENPLESREGDATSAQEPNAINLMTIHGAKGLEFDHVLVPHIGDRPKAPVAKELSVREGVMFFPLPATGELEKLESPLDTQVKLADAEAEDRERNRTLYVAATRAKKTLTFTWSKRESNSWAARSTWFDLPPGDYQKDNYRFQVMDSMSNEAPFSLRKKDELLVRPPFREKSKDGNKKTSVTEMIEKSDKKTGLTDLSLKRLEARSSGEKLHRKLEGLKYGHGANDKDPALQFVLTLKDPPMTELLKHGHVEWGFQVAAATQVVEGQIDLWGVHGGRLYIIDYKSGSVDRLEKAFAQLTLYAWALRRFGRAEPIELVVIYPNLKKVEKRRLGEDSLRRFEVESGLTEPTR